ncbi:MAG TPA: hypothetical protein VFZ85_09655 [Jiangellaceae bacterium]
MRTFAWAVAAAAAVLVALPQAALAGTTNKEPVLEFATGEPVVGAFSQVDRGENTVASKVRTRITPGHTYTLWYVIFNDPAACNGGECGEDDIFLADGSFNFAQIEAARISVVWGKAGDVANPAGRVKLDGGLAVGEVPTGPGIKVVIGDPADGALVPGVVTGLEHTAAEVHLVIQDHGPAHDDPALLELQTTSFQGACNPECVDVQFSVQK